MKHKKKITLFMPGLGGGGAERVMLTVAEGLVAAGFKVDLVLCKAEGVLEPAIPDGVNTVDLNASKVIKSIVPFYRYLKKNKPDIILSALTLTNLAALFVNRIAFTNTKIIVCEHGNFSARTAKGKKRRYAMLPPLAKALYPSADAVVTVSHGTRNDLLAKLPVPENRCKVIYNPLPRKEASTLIRQKVSKTWFTNDKFTVIIGVGSLKKAKNFGLLIKSFSRVYQKNNNCRLAILGEGNKRNELCALAEKLEVKEAIWMPGYVNNPLKYVAKADCFVLSSRWEGFAIVILEALACNTKVVSTDCPFGPSEILEGGKWGQLVPRNNVEKMTNAIIDTLKSPAIDAARRVRDFSKENTTRRYIQLINRLL